jgi:hypothetical protein
MRQITEGALIAEELTRPELDSLGPEWDEMVSRSRRPEPFTRYSFLRTWLDNFAPEARFRLLVARAGERLVAGLPLIEEPSRMYGIPVRKLRAPANVHSCRFDLVCEAGRVDAVEALWSHLKSTRAFDVLEIPDVPSDGDARALLPLAQADGFRVTTWESMRTPYVPLAGGFEAVWSKLDARFRQNLRRRRRKLEQRGKVETERVKGGPHLERYLEEGFALEDAGWKGRSGTAIARDPVLRGYYAEWARLAALRGELSLFFLRLSGRAIGFQYGLASGDTYYLPKTAYDEGERDCSPGQLLMEEVLRDCCERGLKELDFLGPSMPWKQDWTDASRPHHWLYVFGRGAKGAALCELKRSWVPAAKEMLSWRR